MIEVAKYCKAHFNIYFFGYSDKFSYLIEEAGFEFKRMDPWLTEEQIEYLWKIDRMEVSGNPFTESELSIRVKSETKLFDELKPAAVVTGFTLSTPISTRVSRIPFVYIMPFSYTRPFFESGVAEIPEMFDFRLSRVIPVKWRRILLNYWGLNTQMWMKPFRKVAKDYGLNGFKKLMDIFEGDYNLIASAPELTGVKALPRDWSYIGPVFAKLENEIPQSIYEIPKDKPLIYFAMGSSANKSILKEVMAAFNGMPYYVVSPMKFHLENEGFVPPENVFLYDWLPAHKINALADIAVLHGGEGTVQTACSSGKPFIGIGLQPEQEANIDYCVRYGNAIKILRKDFSAQRLHSAIEIVLTDAHIQQKAIEIKEELSKYNGPENAAKFIINKFGSNDDSKTKANAGRYYSGGNKEL
jgi:UDP:flavonoid glycosyltransferase YjiC (YdhE family)